MPAIDLLVTSGSGPAECRVALMALIGIIEAEADRRGCTTDVTFGHRPDRHGAKSALLGLEGANAAALAAEYCGTVKFVFKSPVRSGHKRQNWFVGVKAVDLTAAVPAEASIAPCDVRIETLRAGGPGGQHQNTTDSAVRAVHLPTGIVVTARNERSQHRNKAIALRRLEAMLRVLADRDAEQSKAEIFIANKALERGNEVKVFRL
ncbi:peptide chain release factor H [Mesorhizobium sp. M4A.F.Ca.ET.022.05.2.1]|uniref:peptide chain release factor H n=1 Tax=Mesorhizobium sp. M4A.F.Ca.ET.022.05.2.1 TaxID=2496653 RepID=UPI000FCBE5F0|nr:peptide chain release factor H [Mesorhizobium sp. M4A.F.Ca.ET.022.05.2.1]RVC74983.1 peptide chain release factor H [Mesorhizobium sp. M4A.F.Ca.ET.022.05.2.1]